MIRAHLCRNCRGNQQSLLLFRICLNQTDLLSFLPLREAFLLDSGAVVGYQRVRSIHYDLGGTVVLFKTEGAAVGIVLFEIEDILNLRSTEGIYGLGIVSHYTYIIMRSSKFSQYDILREVGVLILIDHNVVEARGHRPGGFGVVTEQYVHIQQYVIEIHNSRLPALLRIQSVYFVNFRFFRRGVVGYGCLVPSVGLGRDEIVLRH